MALPKFVHVQECGPRDGLQIEAKTLSVAEKVELIDALVATGFNLLGPDMTDSADQAQRRTRRPIQPNWQEILEFPTLNV